jgi:hypothetical protein
MRHAASCLLLLLLIACAASVALAADPQSLSEKEIIALVEELLSVEQPRSGAGYSARGFPGQPIPPPPPG